MSYLIDTQAFIWYAIGDSQLSNKAKTIIESNEVRLISIATIWEMGIKSNIGKLNFNSPFDAFIQKQILINQY